MKKRVAGEKEDVRLPEISNLQLLLISNKLGVRKLHLCSFLHLFPSAPLYCRSVVFCIFIYHIPWYHDHR